MTQPPLARARRSARLQRTGAVRGTAGAIATATLLVPAELFMRRVIRRRKTRLPQLFHRSLSRALGVRITCHGHPPPQKGVLYVSNHLSWADIPVLGARIDAAFVAKADVAGWGAVGWLATLARTVYVERGRRTTTGDQRDAISQRLASGDNIILFPEGTNGDGVDILPFKTALFAVTDALPDLLIQPVTIAYTSINGLPVTRQRLPDLAWVGDTELLPHAATFMALGRVQAEILFHPPVHAGDFADRKALARHCETLIADGYRRLMRG